MQTLTALALTRTCIVPESPSTVRQVRQPPLAILPPRPIHPLSSATALHHCFPHFFWSHRATTGNQRTDNRQGCQCFHIKLEHARDRESSEGPIRDMTIQPKQKPCRITISKSCPVVLGASTRTRRTLRASLGTLTGTCRAKQNDRTARPSLAPWQNLTRTAGLCSSSASQRNRCLQSRHCGSFWASVAAFLLLLLSPLPLP